MREFNYSKINEWKWDSELLGLVAACPSLSISSIEGALRKLVASGELKREGKGKNTCYYRVG